MAEIGNIRNPLPVGWVQKTGLNPTGKEQEQGSKKRKPSEEVNDEQRDDDNHVDEYA